MMEPRDTDAENAVAAKLEAAWGCKLHRFAALHPIDFYAVKHDRMVAVVEIKSRKHASGTFPDVFLSVRKWTRLYEAAWMLDIRAFFVVQFTDGIRRIEVTDIDASKHKIGGCNKVRSVSSQEPVILVDVKDMKEVKA